MQIEKLDHIALWVAERDRIADAATTELGMHVIDRTDAFTLVGADARRGKLTLFAAEGPRERGALAHISLRVRDTEPQALTLPDGLELEVVPAETDLDYDLDHVALFSRDPEGTAEQYLSLGFEAAGPPRAASLGSRSAAPTSSFTGASPAIRSARS